jgi:hypothetical protein
MEPVERTTTLRRTAGPLTAWRPPGELEDALTDLTGNAEDFRAKHAFWDGYRSTV